MHNFITKINHTPIKVGDKVICKINLKALGLTLGKEYKVCTVPIGATQYFLEIENDWGLKDVYDLSAFIIKE